MRTRHTDLLKEGELPANVDPGDPKLDEPEERARIRAGVRAAASTCRSATCCRCSAGTRKPRPRSWLSEKWPLRRGALFLIPGDSPIGFRLPLASLPYVAPPILSCIVDAGRSVRRRARRCPAPTAACAQQYQRGAGRAGTRPRRMPSSARASIVRCAPRSRSSRATASSACVHAAGRAAEDYLELLAAVEATASATRPAGAYRRLSAAARSAPQCHQGHARSRRHRGQYPSGRRTGAKRSRSPRRSTRTRAVAARHREVHARRPPYRHRRRQSRRARRRQRRRSARSCAGPIC